MLSTLSLIPIRLSVIVGQVEPVSLGNAAMRVFVVTLIIALVGFGSAIWLKQRNGQIGSVTSKTPIRSLMKGKFLRQPSGDLTIVSSKRVGPGQILVDVDWQGRRILLGCTANGITSLSEDSSREFMVESES